MTDTISPGLQTLILIGMALLAVLLVQAGRWLARARARVSILRAQEARLAEKDDTPGSVLLPEPWRALRQEVGVANRSLNAPVFRMLRQLFRDHYADGRLTPGGLVEGYGQESYRMVLDARGQPYTPNVAMVDAFRRESGAHPLFRGWFCEAEFQEGRWAGVTTLLAADWLCRLAGLRCGAAQVLLDLPDRPGMMLVQVVEAAGSAADPHGVYDVPCSAAIEGLDSPEVALEMELQEACGLGFSDLTNLRLLLSYNCYEQEGGLEARNEHRWLYRAQLKPESAAALRFSDGRKAGLALVSVSKLRQSLQTAPDRIAAGLRDAIGYYD